LDDKPVDNKSSKYITVACKVGVPWLDFEFCEKTIVIENTQTGTREVERYIRTGKIVRVRGTAYPRGEPPEGFPEKPQFLSGYALTPNVLRETWEAITAQRKKDPLFVNNMVFAYERIEDIRSRAKDHVKNLSGLEPVQRKKDEITDQRLPRSMHSGVSNLEPVPKASAA
jgi:hypothetical protein